MKHLKLVTTKNEERLKKGMHKPLYEYAEEIAIDWGEKISPYAKQYVEAMADLDQITDMYHCDTGHSVVIYFLSNASTWRGETARRVKKELKKLYDTIERLPYKP